MALSEAVNAFSSSSDDGGGIVEITRVSGLLLNTILLLVGSESMPKDMKTLIQKDPQPLNFLDPMNLPKLSHKQLYGDIDLTVMNKSAKFFAFIMQRAPLVGMTSLSRTERVVGCVGGNCDAEHVPMWLCCKERFLYICGECDRISGWSV